jgi:membrane associated rhomboid family serine protease
MKYKATLIIWLLVIVIFIITYSQGLSIQNKFRYGALYVWKGEVGEWWRVITYGFLHNSLQHFIANLMLGIPITLYVENRTNSGITYLIFLLGVIGGGLMFLEFNDKWRVITTGSSAGIWALLAAATFELLSREKINLIVAAILFSSTGLMLYDTITNPNINDLGHYGGYLTGMVIILVYILQRSIRLKINKEVIA